MLTLSERIGIPRMKYEREFPLKGDPWKASVSLGFQMKGIATVFSQHEDECGFSCATPQLYFTQKFFFFLIETHALSRIDFDFGTSPQLITRVLLVQTVLFSCFYF